MIGAIVTSGIGQGEWIPSLTLAPALLIAAVYLAWTEPDCRRSSIYGNPTRPCLDRVRDDPEYRADRFGPSRDRVALGRV